MAPPLRKHDRLRASSWLTENNDRDIDAAVNDMKAPSDAAVKLLATMRWKRKAELATYAIMKLMAPPDSDVAAKFENVHCSTITVQFVNVAEGIE